MIETMQLHDFMMYPPSMLNILKSKKNAIIFYMKSKKRFKHYFLKKERFPFAGISFLR